MGQKHHDVSFGAEDNRCKYNDCRGGARDDGEPDFAHALECRFPWTQVAFGAFLKNALRYYDGVVDQHSNRQHQSHHRQNIQCQSEEIQCAQGDQY